MGLSKLVDAYLASVELLLLSCFCCGMKIFVYIYVTEIHNRLQQYLFYTWVIEVTKSVFTKSVFANTIIAVIDDDFNSFMCMLHSSKVCIFLKSVKRTLLVS